MLGLSPIHVLIFGVVAVLLFGNRLLSAAHSLGHRLVEFKKGMSELESEFKTSIYSHSRYEKPIHPSRIETIFEKWDRNLSPLYWPAIKFGVYVQAILGILTALMLDRGQSLGIFKIAFLCHWLGIFLLLARRPLSPTKTDILFVRWGTPLLMMVVGLIAPTVWNMIGKSDLSGWQRLWSYRPTISS